MPEALAERGARLLFERMRDKRVLVVGDAMLDEWVWGTVSRISPEAPVPVVAVNDHSFTLGGAGNVVSNLRAAGARVAFAASVGDDAEGRRLVELLDAQEVDRSAVVLCSDRPTTRKTRIVAHNQQVVRADYHDNSGRPQRECFGNPQVGPVQSINRGAKVLEIHHLPTTVGQEQCGSCSERIIIVHLAALRHRRAQHHHPQRTRRARCAGFGGAIPAIIIPLGHPRTVPDLVTKGAKRLKAGSGRRSVQARIDVVGLHEDQSRRSFRSGQKHNDRHDKDQRQ